MWREITKNKDGDLAYEPTDLEMRDAYNTVRAELDEDDESLPDLTQWYQQDEEAERQTQIRMHTNIRSEGEYGHRRVRPRRACQFVEDEADESD
jgi:hypothetical protein